MIDSNPVQDAQAVEASGEWSQAPELAQVYVDEALFQFLADRVYLTLGQIQMPSVHPKDLKRPGTVEIRPVARVVFTPSSFHKILAMMNRVAVHVPNTGAAAEEK